MSLTRKHFREIADIVKGFGEDTRPAQPVQGVRYAEHHRHEKNMRDLAERLAQFCASQNPHFDTKRFLEACKVK